MAEKLTLDELLDQFKAMTLVELQAFVKRFEETFGVSAAFVVPSDAMRGRVEVEPDAEVEELTAFDVVLVDVAQGARVRVIKEVRAARGLGLAEAKALVDRVPVAVARGLGRADAEPLAGRLSGGGARVEVRPAAGGEDRKPGVVG